MKWKFASFNRGGGAVNYEELCNMILRINWDIIPKQNYCYITQI